jgi:hypothetical protein
LGEAPEPRGEAGRCGVTPTDDTSQATRRRIQFGPGEVRAGWSPEISSSTPEEEDMYTEREVDLVVNALRDAGEMRRKDLGERIGCKYWARAGSGAPSGWRTSAARSGGSARDATP